MAPALVKEKKRSLSYAGPHAADAMWEFHQRMLNRMTVSGFKYGAVAAVYPRELSAVAQLRLYLERYEETHNLDFLADIANFAGMEDMCPSFDDATRTDSACPGRIRKDGSRDPREIAGASKRRQAAEAKREREAAAARAFNDALIATARAATVALTAARKSTTAP